MWLFFPSEEKNVFILPLFFFFISKFYQPEDICLLPEVPEYGSLDVEHLFLN